MTTDFWMDFSYEINSPVIFQRRLWELWNSSPSSPYLYVTLFSLCIISVIITDFEAETQTLPLAGTSQQKQPTRWARLRVYVTGPIYLLSIHHPCSCRNRSRPWLTAVHSQLCVFHIITSKSVTQEKNQECNLCNLWLQLDHDSVQTCLDLTCIR